MNVLAAEALLKGFDQTWGGRSVHCRRKLVGIRNVDEFKVNRHICRLLDGLGVVLGR